jgi:hypothetical protein
MFFVFYTIHKIFKKVYSKLFIEWRTKCTDLKDLKIFDFRFFIKSMLLVPDSCPRLFSNINSNSLRYSTSKVIPHIIRIRRKIFVCQARACGSLVQLPTYSVHTVFWSSIQNNSILNIWNYLSAFSRYAEWICSYTENMWKESICTWGKHGIS